MFINTFRSFLEEQTNKDLLSGSVLVMKDKESILQYSSGFANREKQILNNIDTIFNIGSMDKMFTAVAIGQLYQDGKLDFQDKISKYLPTYPKEVANKMTIHHLLTHADGLPSYMEDKTFIEKRFTINSISEYIDLFKNKPLLFSPGEKNQYSNCGYIVLGAIIEAVSEKSYYDYVVDTIFKVSNMPDTGSFDPHKENERLAIGYTDRKPFSHELIPGPKRENTGDLPKKGNSAGSGYSTCKDLYNFSQALLQNKLLKPETTKFMLSPKITIGTKNGETLYYGYGFQILETNGVMHRYGHAGAYAGANTRLDMYPILGYTCVVLSNYDQPAAFKVANEFGRLLFLK